MDAPRGGRAGLHRRWADEPAASWAGCCSAGIAPAVGALPCAAIVPAEVEQADERLYSITEAAEKLGVSPATIASWIRLGIAKPSRQDAVGRFRYTEQDLLDMERRFQERQREKHG
jgi:hypothetical protein